MSAEAVGWVYRHSPFSGVDFSVHQAIADSANDQNDNRFWMSLGTLAKKARVSRATAVRAVGKLVDEGFLERLDDFGKAKGEGRPARFRFLFPDVAVVYETRGGAHRATPDSGRTRGVAQGEPQTQEITQDNETNSASPRAVPFVSDFDEWWLGYPRKQHRRAALRAYQARRRAGIDPERLTLARDNFAFAKRDAELRFIMLGSTFLNCDDGPWSEYEHVTPGWAPALGDEPPSGPTLVPDPEQSRAVGPYVCSLGLGCSAGWLEDGDSIKRCPCSGGEAVAS